jgi:AraC-like DNA-binding protein
MRLDLKLGNPCQGLVYQNDATRNPPLLGSHHHTELELNLIVRGRITYLVDGRCWTLGRRSLVWFFPGQEHQLLHRSADARYFVVAVTASLVREASASQRYAGLTTTTMPRFQTSETGPEPFDVLRRHLASLTEDGPDADVLNRELGFGFRSAFRYEHGDPDRLNAGLRYLLLTCWRHHQQGTGPGSLVLHPAVRRALAIIEDQTEAVALDRLAAECGVSLAYLSRLFHQQVGMPMHRYRASRRLIRFWELWSRSKHQRVLNVALAAGFGSYAQFHRTFCAEHGCGPRSYFAKEP